MPPPYVAAYDLQRDREHEYIGTRMRISCCYLDDFVSPSNPDGIILKIPQLQRQTNSEVPSYGKQTLEPGVVYIFGGTIEHDNKKTFVFTDEENNTLQIDCSELPGTVFVLDP